MTLIKKSSDEAYMRIPPIDASAPNRTETATFAMGCFWSPDALFGNTPGVVRTRVGYSGGLLPNPSYYNIGDHIETIQIDYDPNVIEYDELLNIFWENHNHHKPGWMRQYMSAIFHHNSHQEKFARETLDKRSRRTQKTIYTEIMPYSKFFLAEGYHQKYNLRQHPDLLNEYKLIYPEYDDFVASTSAARVNGYISGYGTIKSLQQEIDSFGLSTKGIKKLTDILNLFESRR